MTSLLVFDLDGTLIETGPGIFNSLRKTFIEKELPVPREDVLTQFIGPSLLDAFQEFAHISPEKAPDMVEVFRKHYHRQGIYEGQPYAGMKETLEGLAKKSRLAVATAKPEKSAQLVLEHFGLLHYFDEMVGADETIGRTHKADILAEALARFSPMDKSRVWMIGDRRFDLVGAQENEVDFVAALYGYGSRGELDQAAFAVKNPLELLDLYQEHMR